MLLQTPGPGIEELDNPDPPGKFARSVLLPPPSLQFIATGEKSGPGYPDKVREHDDESPLNGDGRRFELNL